MSIFKGTTEPKHIYMAKEAVVSDMMGPCDAGFHVPLQSEVETLYNIGVNLGIWSSKSGAGFNTYLKMPFAGYRVGSSSNVASQGSIGFYWANGANNPGYSYLSRIQSNYSSVTYNWQRYTGVSIRAFKDTPVAPDSSWTALYSDKIYHNSALGLISIKNGSSWITIQDKNVGATTVYNSGDTLSEDNCGKYYQRGNNYGFPWTGSVTTSGEKVDASTYGPGNYYNDSTFRFSPQRDSSNNQNLRGGVTQGTGTVTVDTDIKAVYLGDTKVRPAVPATAIDYINETGIWDEGQNTNGDYDGIAFTPKVNCTLDKIIFGGSTSGTLKITQSDYASSAGTTYSISNVSEYTLSTPMQLTANTRYTISVNGIVTFSNDAINYPISGTNVTFDYITLSFGNQGYNGWGQTVNGIQTTAI